MPFLSLHPVHFRNLQDVPIDVFCREVFFVGENGQGKSNLLEMLYYSAYGSSFRTRIDAEIIKNGEKDFSVRALFKSGEGHTDSVSVVFRDGKKRIEKNSKSIADRKDMINTIPCVLFCHEDLDFAAGQPERKRFFMDQSLSMYDMLYIDILRKYKKILKSRNQILKNGQYEMLDVYDVHLVQYGTEIQKKRKDAVFLFNSIFTPLYEKIAGIENVSISYEPSWKTESDAAACLRQKRQADIFSGMTLSGPHRDKICFIKDGKPFIPTASTGQKRLTAVLLRIAQAKYYTDITGKKPVLLVDDVLLELDPGKRENVMAMFPDYDQLFCTFLSGEPYSRYMKSNTRIYRIEEGKWFKL